MREKKKKATRTPEGQNRHRALDMLFMNVSSEKLALTVTSAKMLVRGTAVNSLTDFQNYKDDIKVFRSGLYIFNQDHTFVGDIRHFFELE